MQTIKNTILVLFTILSISASAQLNNYHHDLNGNVKQIVVRESYYSGSRVFVNHFNKKGFLKTNQKYNGLEIIKDSLKYESKYKYAFDSKDRISRIADVDLDHNKEKIIVKYNAKYYSLKEEYGTKRFTNNHQRYKTKFSIEMGMGYEYCKWNKDKTQLLQMRFETDEEDWEEYTYNYSYNKKNQLVLEEYKAKVDTVFDIEFIQDSLGNIITHHIFKATESNSFNTTYKYDDYGNCIEEKKIHHNGCIALTTYKYEYDQYNNWVKIDRFVDGEIKESNAREIIYYDKKKFRTLFKII